MEKDPAGETAQDIVTRPELHLSRSERDARCEAGDQADPRPREGVYSLSRLTGREVNYSGSVDVPCRAPEAACYRWT